ncbi:MAG: integrase, partial [Burkholderiaceae bacterium]|nr:integrase [Burkholderiaceae bacterium]
MSVYTKFCTGPTSEKATHKEDKKKLVWLHTFLGDVNLDQIDLDMIDRIRSAKLKEATKATTNRYLALVRAILIRARDEWEW